MAEKPGTKQAGM